jgi:hypothetical protein
VPLLTGVLRYPGRTFQCFSYYSLFSGSPGRTYFFQLDNYFLTSSQFQLLLPGRQFFKCPAAQSPEPLAVIVKDDNETETEFKIDKTYGDRENKKNL